MQPAERRLIKQMFQTIQTISPDASPVANADCSHLLRASCMLLIGASECYPNLQDEQWLTGFCTGCEMCPTVLHSIWSSNRQQMHHACQCVLPFNSRYRPCAVKCCAMAVQTQAMRLQLCCSSDNNTFKPNPKKTGSAVHFITPEKACCRIAKAGCILHILLHVVVSKSLSNLSCACLCIHCLELRSVLTVCQS